MSIKIVAKNPKPLAPNAALNTSEDEQAIEKRLRNDFYDKWRDAGCMARDPAYEYANFMEARVRSVENRIRRLLTGDVLTQEQRTGLLVVAYGSKTGTLKDANLLTVAETALIDRYRQASNAERIALRSILGLTRSSRGGEE